MTEQITQEAMPVETSETMAQRAAQLLVDLNEAILEGAGDLAVECVAVITALAAANNAAIQAAYKQGWDDREGDFLAGTARIGIDDAAIKAAREDGMVAALLAVSQLTQPENGETGDLRFMRDAWNGVVEEAKAAIRALGPTPAFDAAIKEARKEGMEAAAVIAEGRSIKIASTAGVIIAAAIRAAKDQPV